MNRPSSSTRNLRKQSVVENGKKTLLASFVSMAFLLGCGGGGSDGQPSQPDPQPPAPPPPPPPTVSLITEQTTSVDEASNPQVPVQVQLSSAATDTVTATLTFAGTATRNVDYAASAETITLETGANEAEAALDIYRDFEVEGSETIEVTISAVGGTATLGDTNTVTVTVVDEPDSGFDKFAPPVDDFPTFESLQSFTLLPFEVTNDGVQVLFLLSFNPPEGETEVLTVEWSSDPQFEQGVQTVGKVTIEHQMEMGFDDDILGNFYGTPYGFLIPNETLLADSVHYVRGYLGELEDWPGFSIDPLFDYFLEGFLTDENRQVRVTCYSRSREAQGDGDPLFSHQWHIQNTGQTAFAESGGVVGEDLNMTGALGEGLSGEGVKLVVVDSGLEVCHPDLASNVETGGSYNFGHERRPGSGMHDPYNISVLGDHGTSVAGVAAAVANNGLGGRGTASGATIVGFNPLEAGSTDDLEAIDEVGVAFLASLGGSETDPDSASGHIFNMSYGLELPGENIFEEVESLYRMTTAELRDGLGVLYVKAFGNSFEFCDRLTHPVNDEIGCYAGNSDPEQNTPWLINVGAFNADGFKSSYSSAGSNAWIVAPGGEDGVIKPSIITTDQSGAHGGYSAAMENSLSSENALNRDGDYVSAFGGTSAAAPNVSGAIALILEANSQLTWRDVKHILASTARQMDPDRSAVRAAFSGTPYVMQHGWTANAAGFEFHNWYGFGAVDVDAAVAMARTHVPDSLGAFVESEWIMSDVPQDAGLAIPDNDGAGVSASFLVADLPTTGKIEAVQLEVSMQHHQLYDVGITVESPSGTESVVNPPFNSLLDYSTDLVDWRLLSNAFYGEDLNGTWTIQVVDLAEEDTGSLLGVRMRFYYGDASQ